MPGYCSAQTFLNSAPLEVTSGLASRMSDLAARLGALEVPGDLAGALVRPRRAAERLLGDRDREGAAVGHRLELPAQRRGFGPGLPRLQHLPRGCAAPRPSTWLELQFDAGRDHQLVVADAAAPAPASTVLRCVSIDCRAGRAPRARRAGVPAPCRARVMSASCRLPPITRLDTGHETNAGSGSTSTTSIR